MSNSVQLLESQELATDHAKIDQLELAMLAECDLIDMPLVHRFTPGMYIREIFMPAGTLATSKVHKIEHPYVVLKGKCSVFIPGGEVEHIQAPHFGLTQPGTRRVLYVHEDTVWITFHPNKDDDTDLEILESKLIERRELPDGSTVYDHYQEILTKQTEKQVT